MEEAVTTSLEDRLEEAIMEHKSNHRNIKDGYATWGGPLLSKRNADKCTWPSTEFLNERERQRQIHTYLDCPPQKYIAIGS